MDNATFEAIRRGDAQLELRESFEWLLSATRVRGDRRLHTVLSSPLTIFVGVSVATPWAPTFLIRDGESGPNNACRLDVRGTHWNRRTDRRRWDHESHLHIWRDDLGNHYHAVDPYLPWPPDFDDSASTITPAELEHMFDLFCRMFHVKYGPNYQWVDPLSQIAQAPVVTTPAGDVIP